MDKQRYLEELAKYLAPLSAEERQDAIDFYSEMIDDAGLVTWDAMVMKLGKPESLAHCLWDCRRNYWSCLWCNHGNHLYHHGRNYFRDY